MQTANKPAVIGRVTRAAAAAAAAAEGPKCSTAEAPASARMSLADLEGMLTWNLFQLHSEGALHSETTPQPYA